MLAEIVARLKDEVPALKQVQGLAALSQLRGDPPAHQLPAGFVVPLDEVAGDSATTGAVVQLVSVRFGLVLIVGAHVDDAGAAEAAGSLNQVRRLVRPALLGWVPNGAEQGMTFDTGELMAVSGTSIRWMDVFQTSTIYGS